MTRRCQMLAVVVVAVLGLGWSAEMSMGAILLDAVIGVPGTDAALIPPSAGQAVNKTGYASNTGATALDAGSAVSFNFNTGFADAIDRTIGSAVGQPHVFADRHWNTAAATRLIFDTDNDKDYLDETDAAPADANTFHLGFGMHSDTFITFDLDKIRADNGLSGWGFVLTGGAGWAGDILSVTYKTSGAILLDGQVLRVYDWQSGSASSDYDVYDTYGMYLPGTGRYLTFIGLTGLDNTNSYDHVGFHNVALAPAPEPGALVLCLSALVTAAGAVVVRRRRK